jgi:hypothetical protein
MATNYSHYESVVVSVTDYSPFGVSLTGRTFTTTEGYRYGFQNQETDKELWDGAVSYKYRIEDVRLGRFFSVDPLYAKYPWNSNYAFSENRVNDKVELEGLEAADPTWESSQNSNAFRSLWDKKGVISASDYSQLEDALNDAWNSYTTFKIRGRDLSARNMSRYLGGEGGYDIYCYASIDRSSILTFDHMIEYARSKVIQDLERVLLNLEPGKHHIETSILTTKGQAASLLSDYGTAFGSAALACNIKCDVVIDENGDYCFSGGLFYTFGDTYKWHPSRVSEMSFESDIADHTQLASLAEVGARNFSVRAYFSQIVWGNSTENFVGGIGDSKEAECPEIEGYYALPDGAELKYDYGKK